MADKSLQEDASDITEQPTEDVPQQPTGDVPQQPTGDVLQTGEPVNTTLPQNTTNTEMDETSIYTTTPQEMHDTQDQSAVFIENTIAQNSVENIVVHEAEKPDEAEMVYPTTTAEEPQQSQDVVEISNAANVVPVLHAADKSGSGMAYQTATAEEPQQSQDVVDISNTMSQSTIPDVALHAVDKPGSETVYPMTTTEEPQQGQDVVMSTAMTQSVVLHAAEKPEVEMVYTAAPSGSQESQDVVGISTAMAQNAVANVVLNEADKPGTGEMVFTVVAMGNNIGDLMHMNPESLPKEVQLSLVQPPPSDNSTTNSGQLSDINQLALIAASIEENPKESGPTTQVETPVVQARNSEDKQDSSVKSLKGRVLCTVCNQDFSDLPSMRRHRLIHSEDKPFHCDFCDKSFRRKDNLREHRNIHTQENIYKCDRCGKTFPRKYTHKVHMSRFCGKAGPVVSGTEAWGSPDKAANAKPGLAAKSSEPCHICFKTFRDASTLKRHLLTHSDERPYKCSECEKAFRRKDHLQEHVIVHKLVRPFTCQTCGKSFSRKNGLKTHMIRTTHLLGFDDIVLPGQSKDSADVEVQVVEQVLAADQLVTSSSEVFPEPSQGDDDVQAGQDSDISETNLQPGNGTSHSDEFSQAPTNSENLMEAETTVVLSEKSTKETDLLVPESDEPPSETSVQDIESNADNTFVCPSCNGTFPGKDELWEHFQEHLEENMFACRHCFEMFANAELLDNHQRSCDDEEDASVIRNEAGSQTCEAIDDLGQPATLEEGEASNDEIPTTPNSKKRKRINASDRTDQTCSICSKAFRDATALKRHTLVHSGERPHACSHCEKRFRRRDHLKAHQIAHHSGITSHECKTCDAAFNTRYALTVHVKSCKNRPSSPKEPVSEEVKLVGSPESKQCPICHKVFKDPSTQRRHFRIHSDERPFHCDICSKSFRRKDNLKEHLLCHSDEKPFSCAHCGKSLSRRSSLTNHMNVCSARKSVPAATISSTAAENPIIPEIQFTEPAVQDMCVSGDPQEISAAHLLATGLTSSVVTSDIASLDVTSSEMTSELVPMEEDIEHGLRDEDDGSGTSFPCEECGKVFRAKWTLRFHQRIHTGEKPYTCKTCDRQFRQASHLKIHERTHSGERPYQCQICGRAFIDSSTMKRHERLHKDAADPNAVIDEQHDVTAEDDIINSENDVIKDQEYVITDQVINDSNEANVVQQAVEVSIADEGAIQLLVTTASSELANSAQPISTSVVTGMNQSETRLDESNLGQILRDCIRSQGVEKIGTLEDWQENQPNESVEQLIYIETEQEGPSETE